MLVYRSCSTKAWSPVNLVYLRRGSEKHGWHLVVWCRSWCLYESNSSTLRIYSTHQRTTSLSCCSRSSQWFLARLGLFGLKIDREQQFRPKPQAWFSSADYLCHALAYRSLLYTYCTTPLFPSEESLSAVYLSLAWGGFGGFCWRWWCYICCMCHWVPAVSFSDYMSTEEYFEEDEEPPLLLSSCLPDRKFQTH